MNLRTVASGLGASSKAHVRRADAFAARHLSDIHRRSGESYHAHGVEVAAILRERTVDGRLLAVAILHDISLHPNSKTLLKQAPLDASDRELLQHMHALRRLRIDSDTKDLDFVISAFAADSRLLPLRMAHRLNDIRHLFRFDTALQLRIARETLHMYTAIAGRMGFNSWRAEMEDICFPIVHPSASKMLQEHFAQSIDLDRASLLHTSVYIQKTLLDQHISCKVHERIKGLFSTYRKMILKKRSFEEVTDRLALRVIVPTVDDCYRALGVVHTRMHPIPGKLKDYIGAPKQNGYKSIHTVVYPLPGVTEQPIEIQIRTPDMHRECEFGPVAHDEYKHTVYGLSSGPTRVHLFRNLQSLRQEARSPKQFEQALRTYFREDHMAIFDADNHLYHIQKPATALDFACLTVGRKCTKLKRVRINGRDQQLDAQLKDGDTVELHFSRSTTYTRSWLETKLQPATRALLKEISE